MLDWATENAYLHGLLQRGISDALITLRATFKQVPKNKEWNESKAIEKIHDLDWKPLRKPNQGNAKVILEATVKNLQAMADVGLAKTKIKSVLKKQITDENEINAIMELINF